jgi:nucleotide-binding universal stress UspA family protein
VPVELAVRYGDPAREILAEAAEFGADLITLGVSSRRRFLMLGGVAEQLFRRADVPVAFFRAGRRERGGH